MQVGPTQQLGEGAGRVVETVSLNARFANLTIVGQQRLWNPEMLLLTCRTN